MKAIVVRQPWASLIACGVKTIETRGFRPTNTIKPGEQFAIVAGAKKPKEDQRVGPFLCHEYADGRWRYEDERTTPTRLSLPLALGAAVAVATYDEALPCVDDPTPDGVAVHERCLFTDNTLRLFTEGWDFIVEAGAHAPAHTAAPLTSQLPLGDFSPGRFGWMLSNAHRLNRPVPCPAKRPDGTRTVMQGVFTLPDDVLADVLPQLP